MSAPDDRDIDDISAKEKCSYCGWSPAAIILVDGEWQCYNCGHDPDEEDPLVTDGGIDQSASAPDCSRRRDLGRCVRMSGDRAESDSGVGHVAPSRVVAGLAHNPNVRKGVTDGNGVRLYLTNNGIGLTVLKHLRSFGYEIASISPRFGTVRCIPAESPAVEPKHDSDAIEDHRGGLITDGGRVEDAEGVTRDDLALCVPHWQEKAEHNVENWGEQTVETLLLATQEELGELTQAALEYRAEDGYYGPLFEELDDLGALLIQLYWALNAHRFDRSPQEVEG